MEMEKRNQSNFTAFAGVKEIQALAAPRSATRNQRQEIMKIQKTQDEVELEMSVHLKERGVKRKTTCDSAVDLSDEEQVETYQVLDALPLKETLPASKSSQTPDSTDSGHDSTVQIPAQIRRPKSQRFGNPSIQASEFVAFAAFKLCNQKNNVKWHGNTSFLQQSMPRSKIICPPGTKDWYPQYVMQIHTLLKSCALSTPFILMGLLYIARAVQVSLPEQDQDTDFFSRRSSGNNDTTSDASEDDDAALNEYRPEYIIFLASLMLSQKQNSDSRYANTVWAKLSSPLSLKTINKAERILLKTLSFKAHITDVQYVKWEHAMQALGKEHAIVLRAASVEMGQAEMIMMQLKNRPDLVKEILKIRLENI